MLERTAVFQDQGRLPGEGGRCRNSRDGIALRPHSHRIAWKECSSTATNSNLHEIQTVVPHHAYAGRRVTVRKLVL